MNFHTRGIRRRRERKTNSANGRPVKLEEITRVAASSHSLAFRDTVNVCQAKGRASLRPVLVDEHKPELQERRCQ